MGCVNLGKLFYLFVLLYPCFWSKKSNTCPVHPPPSCWKPQGESCEGIFKKYKTQPKDTLLTFNIFPIHPLPPVLEAQGVRVRCLLLPCQIKNSSSPIQVKVLKWKQKQMSSLKDSICICPLWVWILRWCGVKHAVLEYLYSAVVSSTRLCEVGLEGQCLSSQRWLMCSHSTCTVLYQSQYRRSVFRVTWSPALASALRRQGISSEVNSI